MKRATNRGYLLTFNGKGSIAIVNHDNLSDKDVVIIEGYRLAFSQAEDTDEARAIAFSKDFSTAMDATEGNNDDNAEDLSKAKELVDLLDTTSLTDSQRARVTELKTSFLQQSHDVCPGCNAGF